MATKNPKIIKSKSQNILDIFEEYKKTMTGLKKEQQKILDEAKIDQLRSDLISNEK